MNPESGYLVIDFMATEPFQSQDFYTDEVSAKAKAKQLAEDPNRGTMDKSLFYVVPVTRYLNKRTNP
jgi:hypothetical protein